MFGKLIVIAAAWVAISGDAVAADIDNLDYLTGYWFGEKDGRTFEEMWMPAGAATKVGVWRSTRDGELAFTEHFLVWENDDGLFLRISLPAERYGVLSDTSGVMRAVAVSTDHVRFEKEPDAPGGLAAYGYALTGDGELRIDVTLVEDADKGISFSHFLTPRLLISGE